MANAAEPTVRGRYIKEVRYERIAKIVCGGKGTLVFHYYPFLEKTAG